MVDVIPVDIYEHFIEKCNTRFQTETKKPMHGKLPENSEQLIGLPVYIWGSKSSPGLGMLDSIMDMQDTAQIRCIKIHDRADGHPFSQPGDSGAIVCATDREARTLTTIAMLIGKFEGPRKPTYMAILLN
ncbi:hypothetical protein DPMN_117813 [Dreissena polymorpha]|uniref:Uncharacterized protein n=1 Tax=Dreissena polymorpha TaxID=45954 RepID=A0A9D4GJP3_DREPO|nr:hypothetical protein DPMN_117813 [Dreissena polymorpha]